MGAAIYGTCDPKVAWCCRKDASGVCSLAVGDEAGTCVKAGNLGDNCGIAPVMSYCQSGHHCVDDLCSNIPNNPLKLGEKCNGDFSFKGHCTNSYCDIFGTGMCQALKPVGSLCMKPKATVRKKGGETWF